ncbi:hypothetical protein COT72_01900 [archaeon CG10_big_fil_rev_8_21_14_0_10_43_11]|nr:MAG: hypothetical protein COT72_01900 [archaeon CG10_big_fil_rev_8_21_14_0_10_43_11]
MDGNGRISEAFESLLDKERFQAFINSYAPLTLKEYMSTVVKGKKVGMGFGDITESSPERLYRILSDGKISHPNGMQEYLFFRTGDHPVTGLSDVLNTLTDRLYQASLLYKQGKVPLILLVGPTGSGKTHIGQRLEEGLVEELERNPRYTFGFKKHGETANGAYNCPLSEEPLHLLTSKRSLLPSFITTSHNHAGELCSSCTVEYSKRLIDEASGFREFAEKFSDDGFTRYRDEDTQASQELEGGASKILDMIGEFVKVIRLKPNVASIELTDKNFYKKFPRAIESASRGILNIAIDDRDLDHVPDISYQLLLNLADKRVTDETGKSSQPDLTAFLYGNENVAKEIENRAPFEDRILPVYVRRNLSYSEEQKIYERANIPFKHFSPGIMKLVSMFSVATRVKHDGDSIAELFDDDDPSLFEIIDVYDRFETYKQLSKKEFEFVHNRLRVGKNVPPSDGWTEGFSARRVVADLFELKARSKHECFTLDSLLDFVKAKADTDDDYIGEFYPHATEFVMREIGDVVESDVSLAYRSVVFDSEGGLERLETFFSTYLDLIKKKALERISEVDVAGRGRVPIDEHISELVARLNVIDGESLKKEVDDWYYDKESKPLFSQIVEENPWLIEGGETLDDYIDWEQFAGEGGLNSQDKERLQKLLDKLEHKGYCDECGISTLRYYAREVIR